jgi:threonine synthase
VIELGERHGLPLADLLRSVSISDPATRQAMRTLWGRGYLADPHSALAWLALDEDLDDEELGVFLCTAHPAKFLEVIEETLGIVIPLPPVLEAVRNKEVLSQAIPGEFEALKAVLRS